MQEQLFRRRQFLGRIGSVTTFAGLGILSSPARGATYVPVISTRGHFDDSANLTSRHTTTDYDTDGTVPGVDTGCVNDLLVFIHGWTKNGTDSEAKRSAEEKFEHADTAFDEAGYRGTVAGYSWDNNKGGGLDLGWEEAKSIAQKNGPKLAQFCLDYTDQCGGTLRLASHSLGAQVLFSALRALDSSSYWNNHGYRIESTHLFGAATDNETPTREDIDSYNAVTDGTRATFNYYSQEDNVLSWIYNMYEFDQALGETGAEYGNTPAPNYTDFNATAQVDDNHSGYLAATADEAVYHMDHIGQYD
jgi:esterase/lipase superfamily enzyme